MSDPGPDPAGPQPRVTCVISSLSVGGAERVLTALANRWVANGWSVTILTFSGPAQVDFYRPDPRVVVRRLDLIATSGSPVTAIARNLGRLVRLRRAIGATRPDAVLSFMDRTNVLTLLATAGHPWPVVVSERTDPGLSPGLAWGVLRGLAYRRASRVVVQTATARAALPAGRRGRVTVIPNPILEPGTADPVAGHLASGGPLPTTGALGSTEAEVTAPGASEPGAGEPGNERVIALGRLDRVKGFDLLLEAFASVHAARPAARLEIWGEGRERAALETRRHELGLDGVVDLPGETRTPAAAIARGSLLALPSRHEGFPNVLLEAMQQGVVPVAFDCPHGPAEIIRDGVDGVLVPVGDVPALGAAIGALLADPGRRTSLGARAREVRERFDLERIGQAWDALLAPGLEPTGRHA